jgi:hypothetical protein
MDPTNPDEEVWCSERRNEVIAYLGRQPLQFGEVGEVPAWFTSPLVSIWAIESLQSLGWVGWWAISGDLPTDYCSAHDCRHPRLAMRRFAEEWRAAIARTGPEEQTIDDMGLPASLAPLLHARADLLFEFSNDDGLWED